MLSKMKNIMIIQFNDQLVGYIKIQSVIYERMESDENYSWLHIKYNSLHIKRLFNRSPG